MKTAVSLIYHHHLHVHVGHVHVGFESIPASANWLQCTVGWCVVFLKGITISLVATLFTQGYKWVLQKCDRKTSRLGSGVWVWKNQQWTRILSQLHVYTKRQYS